ncbi:MAG: hypothetical protein EOL91_13245, partial [Actinobacteria bacterium]|nr:hypothetical protein [Actinomycetota bacterium]
MTRHPHRPDRITLGLHTATFVLIFTTIHGRNRRGHTHHDRKTHMTTELSYRNEGANVYAQDGTLVCIAVDPLDAEVLAGLLRWKVDIHPEPAPEPDPWPAAPLIVADWTSGGQQGGRGLLYRET